MRYLFTIIILVFFLFSGYSQIVYPSLNLSLLSKLDPEKTYAQNFGASGNEKYSGCYGWYQASKNKEYAIIGSSSGAYFIDVTIPTFPLVVDSIKVNNAAVHREIKTYNHYAYITTDEPNGRICVVDMQYLPDSVHEIPQSVHNLPSKAHTIFIDNNKLYLASTLYTDASSNISLESLAAYSLATPEMPVLLRRIEQDYSTVNSGGCNAHDIYVNNDTIFASCMNDGLRVYKLTSLNTFSLLAIYSGYQYAGYNHSSSLSADKKHLVFCDEVPTALPAKIIDVSDLGNIQPLSAFNSHPQATPHNPYIVGNKWCLVSTYEDGLYLYDISNPNNVSMYGYFDTHPQHGFNDNYPNGYAGNWGAYPNLPSKIILALDMQNGLFILEGDANYKNGDLPTGLVEKSAYNDILSFPNPTMNIINIKSELEVNGKLNYQIVNSLGSEVMDGETDNLNFTINLVNLNSGIYFLRLHVNNSVVVKKFVKE